MNTELRQLSIDLNRGKPQGNFSMEDGNEMIRGAILEACGGKFDRYALQDNKGAIFRILSEVMTPGLGELLIDGFGDLADVRDVELGDTIEFEVADSSLFRVANVSLGNRDIRRQKIYSNKIDINTGKLAIKVYAELDRFLAGRIDWVELTERVQKSYKAEISRMIYEGVYESYSDLEAPYAASGVFDEEVLADMIAHVEASTGQSAMVFGTKKALSKVTLDPNFLSDSMKDELNLLGHIGNFKGTPLVSLPQGYKPGTKDFLVSDTFLLVVPADEKIVKVVLEGDVVVDDTSDQSGATRNDEQIEFFLGRRVGVGVLKSDRYGIYRLDEEVGTKNKFSDLVKAVEGEEAVDASNRSFAAPAPKVETKETKVEAEKVSK